MHQPYEYALRVYLPSNCDSGPGLDPKRLIMIGYLGDSGCAFATRMLAPRCDHSHSQSLIEPPDRDSMIRSSQETTHITLCPEPEAAASFQRVAQVPVPPPPARIRPSRALGRYAQRTRARRVLCHHELVVPGPGPGPAAFQCSPYFFLRKHDGKHVGNHAPRLQG